MTLKSAISGEYIYMLLTWADPTDDNTDEVWRYDGAAWTQGPIDDAVAIFWDIDDSISGFNKTGCRVLCHAINGRPTMNIVGPDTAQGLWSGAKQRGDIWDMSLGISNVRGAGNDYFFGIDEAYANNPTAVAPVIRRRHDAFTARAPFELNKRVDPATGKNVPRYRLRAGLTATATPYPQITQVEEITDYAAFKAGDMIPFVVFYPLDTPWGGSRDDLAAKGVWLDGHWTVEFKRKLNTGHPADDIKFVNKAGQTSYYVFDVALFNRTIDQHTYSGPISLEIR